VVTEEMTANNGDVEVLPKARKPSPPVDYDEINLNGLRYQLPEEILVLDFWGRLHGQRYVGFQTFKSGFYTNISGIQATKA
jgi:hypothetical protein